MHHGRYIDFAGQHRRGYAAGQPCELLQGMKKPPHIFKIIKLYMVVSRVTKEEKTFHGDRAAT